MGVNTRAGSGAAGGVHGQPCPARVVEKRALSGQTPHHLIDETDRQAVEDDVRAARPVRDEEHAQRGG